MSDEVGRREWYSTEFSCVRVVVLDSRNSSSWTVFSSRVQSTPVASSLLNFACRNDSDGTLGIEQSVRMDERCWIASRAPGCAFTAISAKWSDDHYQPPPLAHSMGIGVYIPLMSRDVVIIHSHRLLDFANAAYKMDSDEDAPPPPPPSCPPPGGEEEKVPVSSSEKFKALQSMLSGVPTMYSPSKDSEPAPPPSKRAHTEPEDERDSQLEESPQLKHTTKDRPRRKVRPPSRKGRSGGRDDFIEAKQLPHDEILVEEVALPEEAPPDLPPPPPPLSDLPTEISGIT